MRSRGNALIDLIFIFQLLSVPTIERLTMSQGPSPGEYRSVVYTPTPPGAIPVGKVTSRKPGDKLILWI